MKIKIGATVFVIIGVVIAIVGFRINRYKNAVEEYEETIKKLEAENETLSDPIAQYEVASTTISISEIDSKIQSIGELATVEYLYTDAGKFEDSTQLFGQDVPFTKKSFIMKWSGTIKAGIKNVKEITSEINEANKEIVVHIPKAEILSHDPDEDSVEILDESNGLFNSIKAEDVKKFDADSEKKMEERAIEKGILETSFENAKDIIYKILYTDEIAESGYKITFQMIE